MDPVGGKASNLAPLEDVGVYVDDLQKLRALDPENARDSSKLKDEACEFLAKSEEFRKKTDDLIQLSDKVAKQVETEKVAALGARNKLKSVSRSREQETVQLQTLIVEKFMQFERLRIQLESLQKVEAQQQEFIEQFMLQK